MRMKVCFPQKYLCLERIFITEHLVLCEYDEDIDMFIFWDTAWEKHRTLRLLREYEEMPRHMKLLGDNVFHITYGYQSSRDTVSYLGSCGLGYYCDPDLWPKPTKYLKRKRRLSVEKKVEDYSEKNETKGKRQKIEHLPDLEYTGTKSIGTARE